jgi:hypothetical protein
MHARAALTAAAALRSALRPQTLEYDITGTSINAVFDSVAGVLTLSGLDTLESYRRVLASVRYRNGGIMLSLPGRTPPASVLNFTAGVRTLVVVVNDGAGGIVTASSTVECVPEARTGVAGRDPGLVPPQDCNGHGQLTLQPYTVRRARACRSGARYALTSATLPHCRARRRAPVTWATKETRARSRPAWGTAHSP